MKKIFFLCFLILSFSRFAEAVTIFHDFKIEPNSLFVGEERGVLFTVRVESQSRQKPTSFILLEMDSSGEKVRYRWELKDDGIGDFKANDAIYSRIIQFKEKQPKALQFLVVPRKDPIKDELNTSPLRATLEIKARPTFIEVLEGIWERIKRGRVLQ